MWHNMRADGSRSRRSVWREATPAEAEKKAEEVKLKKGWAVSKEWPMIHAMLVEVLERFPDAKKAVSAGLAAMMVGPGTPVVAEGLPPEDRM